MQPSKILIVEDETVVAFDIRRQLLSLGYAVIGSVARGEEAIELAGLHRPDLVLMDIKLQGAMDGIAAASHIWQQWNIPVIYITAFTDDETLLRARLTQPYGYILKPFDDRTLASNIEIALYKYRTDRELSAQEAYYRALIENSFDLINIVDAQGVLQYSSPSVLRLLGYAPDEVLGKLVFDLIYPDDKTALAQEFQVSMLRPSPEQTSEVRVLHKDGSMRVLEVSSKNQLDHPLIAGFITSSRDITERKRAEEEIRRLYQAENQRAAEIETLRHAAEVITSALETGQVLDRILLELKHIAAYDSAAVMLFANGELRIKASYGFDSPDLLANFIHPGDDPLSQEIIRTQQPILLADAQNDPRFQRWHETDYVRGWMGIPLIARGELIGYMTVDSRTPNAYDARKIALAQALANQAAIAIDNAHLYEAVQRLAMTDPLTGIYNRRQFFDHAAREFERAQRYSRMMALIILDIDHFKLVNDRFGHQCGDEILRQLTRRCRELLREVDILGRYGGEEFIVLLPETRQRGAQQAAERIRCAIGQTPFLAGEQSITLTVSVGVADIADDCRDIDTLVRRADRALYLAKEKGRNCVQAWDNAV